MYSDLVRWPGQYLRPGSYRADFIATYQICSSIYDVTIINAGAYKVNAGPDENWDDGGQRVMAAGNEIRI